MRDRINAMTAAWNRFWFAPCDPTPLAAVRIGTGLVLLYSYLTIALHLFNFVGPNAWIDSAAVEQFRGLESPTGRWWGWSVYFLVQQPWAFAAIYVVFLGCIVAFTMGLFTRIVAVAVWVGHISFIHGSFLTWSGMDTVLAMLTFYLMFAPSGAALSLDGRRRGGPLLPSWSANACLRMIQVHMCVIYLCAGLSKLQGARWWDGTAVWTVMMMHEFAPLDFSWIAWLGDWPCLLISNVGVLLTLGFEISFAFLIWNRTVRPMLLLLAVLLHGGIGLFMGMSAFGASMLAGCLAFASAEEVRWFKSHCESLWKRLPIRRRSTIPAPATSRAA